jgi:thioredoxin reductase (NADPH)
MAAETRDITIIGGGPTGLFAAFYAGMRGVTCRIVDSLPELGGQLAALYPEKYIFDVGGYPKVLAKDLVASLVAQGLQFGPEVVLDEQVTNVARVDDGFELRSPTASYRSRSIVIAGGKGAFEPMPLKCPGYEEFMHAGVEYSVRDPEAYRGKRVVVVGGGDSALDFVLMLKGIAASLTLVHRRDGWRAHAATVTAMEQSVEDGEIELKTFHEVRAIHGNGVVDRVTIFDNRSDEDLDLPCEAIISCLGFKPDLGPIKAWGIEVEKNRIRVDAHMSTNVPGIFAAGDIVDYDGKLDLIATGFAEATRVTRRI